MRRPDDAGPREPDFDFPERCPNCDADNIDGDGELRDESYFTCGKQECIEAQKKLEAALRAADREADEAQAAEYAAEERRYNEQWEQELSERDPEP
jgi:hypothetical protein